MRDAAIKQISIRHLKQLKTAKSILENPGLTAKITNIVGKPIEGIMRVLPEKASDIINSATRKSLEVALDTALLTIDKKAKRPPNYLWHKISVMSTGAGGGAFGLAGLAVELPVSTAIILRSIADIAQSEGEDIQNLETKLACMEVFALGGQTSKDDTVESGYFAVRAVLARAVAAATKHIAERGLVKEGAPALVRLIALISGRFGIIVSEKVAAQAVPAIGAVGGALVNLVFIGHFQQMARGHFIIRRLERTYGSDLVKSEYMKIGID
jgi:hypothetical protein